MAELFASGRLLDLILALVVLEALLLWGYRRLTGRGPLFMDLAPTLASGGLLLLALRLTLAGLWWGLPAAALTLALLTHLLDLWRRWGRDAPARPAGG